jgi:hypothetical protein
LVFQREKQHVAATELLQNLANQHDLHLNQCVITGLLDINRLFTPAESFQTHTLVVTETPDNREINLPQSIIFDKCIFEENVVFSAPWLQPDSLKVKFENEVVFNRSRFKGQARFRNATFHKSAGFDGCAFDGVVTFKNATFEQEAKFRTVEFSGYFISGSAVFEKTARFTNSHFTKGANFDDVKFLDQTDFNGVYSSSRSVPAYDSVYFQRSTYGEDESFWRFVKQSAQEAGYYQLAGEAFYNERRARLWQKFRRTGYDELNILRKFVRIVTAIRLLPEFLFGKLLFGYGERPTRVLVAGAMIIIACAFFYSSPGMLISRSGTTEASFMQGLYFSTITFTTLGYGDLYPSPDNYCRVLAMAEAITGGCLMALFVVCLAKRFSRG